MAAAREEIAALESLCARGRSALRAEEPEGKQPASYASDDDDAARRVYNGAVDGGRTQDLLKALPRDDEHPLTFAELGELMRPWDDGDHLSAAQVRACYRNEKRIERWLKKHGVISEDRVIIRKVQDDAEGVGRYYVSGPDHDLIKSL